EDGEGVAVAEGFHRLEPKRRLQAGRSRVLAAREARAAVRIDAGDVEGGRGGGGAGARARRGDRTRPRAGRSVQSRADDEAGTAVRAGRAGEDAGPHGKKRQTP